jgi:hypothetical protein
VFMAPGSPPAVRASAGTTVVARRTNLRLYEMGAGQRPCFRPVFYRERCNLNVSRRGVAYSTRHSHTM